MAAALSDSVSDPSPPPLEDPLLTNFSSSARRRRLAGELARACPADHGREIAVTGSAALGLADATSDLELNFWVDELPPVEARRAWLERVGATEIVPDDAPLADGSHWLTFRFRDIWVEAGWQTIADLVQTLDEILAGALTSHDRLLLASLVAHAVAVRTDGALATWQARLASYPEVLGERVIAANTTVWHLPHAVQGRWALVRRGDSLALTERLLWDTSNVLRVLYALNRQWEPDWKWLRFKLRDLTRAPDRLAERIDLIFSTGASPRERVVTCQQLILDTLALLPSSPGIVRAREVVDQSLRGGEFVV